jgi:hypothetical protein
MDVCDNGHLPAGKEPQGMSRLKLFLVPAGLALAAWLVWQLGPERVWAQLAGGYWPAFGWVIGAYIAQQALGTFALWLLGTKRSRAGWNETPFWRLARIRYVGEVLNFSMPTGTVAGEPYKYLVLSRAEGKRSAFQALASAKFLHLAGIGPFTIVILFGAAARGIGGELWASPLVSLGILSLVVTAAAWSLVLWQGIGRGAAAIHIQRSWGRSIAAYACYTGMWWAAAFEWLAIAEVLGFGWRELGVLGAGTFECTTLIVGVVPVPAGMGTQEAGKAAIAGLLALAPQTGIAMSLVRRGREILMVLAGFVIGLAGAFRTQRNKADTLPR